MVQNNNPLVSVIIPAYNCQNTICSAIESIIGQTYPNIEIVIVDDGSTDKTWETILKYNDKAIIIHQHNMGPADARNTGILASSGSYIAYQDADDISYSNRIETEMSCLLSNNLDMVYSGTVGREGYNYFFPQTPEYNAYALLSKNYIPCGTVLHRRECLDVVGMWNENIDWDLWIRISEHFKIGFVNDRLYEYSIGTGISTDRGILKNKYIDLQTFSDRYVRIPEKWIQFKLNRIAFEIVVLENIKLSDKNIKRFLLISRLVSEKIEKCIRLVSSHEETCNVDNI